MWNCFSSQRLLIKRWLKQKWSLLLNCIEVPVIPLGFNLGSNSERSARWKNNRELSSIIFLPWRVQFVSGRQSLQSLQHTWHPGLSLGRECTGHGSSPGVRSSHQPWLTERTVQLNTSSEVQSTELVSHTHSSHLYSFPWVPVSHSSHWRWGGSPSAAPGWESGGRMRQHY